MVNITLKGKKLESFCYKIRNKTRVPTLTIPIQHGTEVLTKATRQEKEKGIQIRKKEVKWSLFADDMVLYKEKC